MEVGNRDPVSSVDHEKEQQQLGSSRRHPNVTEHTVTCNGEN